MADIYGGIGPEYDQWKKDVAGGAKALYNDTRQAISGVGLGGSVPETYRQIALREAPQAGGGQPRPQAQNEPVYAPRGVTSGGMPDKFSADGSDIKGAAARINPNPKSYEQMARDLSAASQERMGVSRDNSMMGIGGLQSQLANIMALRQYDQPPSMGGVLGDVGGGRTQVDLDNDEKTRRWAMDGLRISDREKARMGVQLQKDATEQRGQSMTQGVAADRNRIAEQGQGLDARTRMDVARMQGQNQLAAYGLQGQNQLANTMLGEGLRGRNQQAVEDSRYERESGLLDRRLAVELPYREAQAGEAKARAGLYTAQGEQAQRALDFDKTADASVQKWAKLFIDGGMEPQAAIREAARMYLGSKRETERRANGGLVGYADGGAVDPKTAEAQRVYQEMQQKYGLASAPAPQAPAPVPQAAPQQPRQESWAEKARRLATGGLDQRMKGYAGGGPIAVGGRQVLGAGSGKSDSLPAEIDGEHPAALSTGEFVMPVEAVQHFGLDRLNKMVAAARKGLATGREAE